MCKNGRRSGSSGSCASILTFHLLTIDFVWNLSLARKHNWIHHHRNCICLMWHSSLYRFLCRPWMVTNRIRARSRWPQCSTCPCKMRFPRNWLLQALLGMDEILSYHFCTDLGSQKYPGLTNEFWCAKQDLQLLIWIVFTRHSKVNKFDAISGFRQAKHIFRFQIQVDDVLAVQIINTFAYLTHKNRARFLR